jgi:hypothetical protein
VYFEVQKNAKKIAQTSHFALFWLFFK